MLKLTRLKFFYMWLGFVKGQDRKPFTFSSFIVTLLYYWYGILIMSFSFSHAYCFYFLIYKSIYSHFSMLWSHTFDSPPGQITLISIVVHTRRRQHRPALQFCSTLNTTLLTCDWLPWLCRFRWVPAGQPRGSWAWLRKGPCSWVCTSIWLISRTNPYKRHTLMTSTKLFLPTNGLFIKT